MLKGELLTKIFIQTRWPKQQAVPDVVREQLWQHLHLIKKNAVTKLIASSVIQQFLNLTIRKQNSAAKF